jgi:hypothetical protein
MAKVKFQVVLENVELSKAQTAAIQKEINAVVARHLLTAKTSAAAAAMPALAYKIPKEWLGIWIKKLKLPTDIVKFGGKQLGKLPGL